MTCSPREDLDAAKEDSLRLSRPQAAVGLGDRGPLPLGTLTP